MSQTTLAKIARTLDGIGRDELSNAEAQIFGLLQGKDFLGMSVDIDGIPVVRMTTKTRQELRIG